MRSEIRRICKATGITTVYVTHDQKEALSMADSVAVLRDGKTVQIGPPRTLYDRPASRFVADFLGETNFLPAVVAGADGGMVTLETPAGILHSTAGVATTPQGGNVTCSIRPEALSVSEAGDGRNSFCGKCLHSTYLGEIAQHLVELADGSTLKVLQLNPSHVQMPTGNLRLQIDPDDVVILAD